MFSKLVLVRFGCVGGRQRPFRGIPIFSSPDEPCQWREIGSVANFPIEHRASLSGRAETSKRFGWCEVGWFDVGVVGVLPVLFIGGFA